MFSTYISQLYGFVDGSLDSTKYEDSCRNILGNKSYTLYTLDKVRENLIIAPEIVRLLIPHLQVVQQSIKCLQALSTDDTISKLIGIFIHHRLTPGGTSPSMYQCHVANTLKNTLEEVYRLQVMIPYVLPTGLTNLSVRHNWSA